MAFSQWDFQPPGQARSLHTTLCARPPHAGAEKAKVGFRVVVSPQISRLDERAGFERTQSLVTGSEEASVPILACSPGLIPPLAP